MGKHSKASVCPFQCGDSGDCGCENCILGDHVNVGPSGHCFMPSSNCHKGCSDGLPA